MSRTFKGSGSRWFKTEKRYRQVMKLKRKRQEIEKLENERDSIVSKMAELQNLPNTSTYEDLDKLEIDIADDEKYQTLLCKLLLLFIFLVFFKRFSSQN